MGFRILIVDDSSIVRKVLKKALALTSTVFAAIFEAENGAEALEVLSREKVDLIFLDINMPIMNGMEFMKNLSEDAALSHIPVVIISTEGSKERKDELYAREIRAYLRKPFTPELLTSTISQILGE